MNLQECDHNLIITKTNSSSSRIMTKVKGYKISIIVIKVRGKKNLTYRIQQLYSSAVGNFCQWVT